VSDRISQLTGRPTGGGPPTPGPAVAAAGGCPRPRTGTG